MEATIIFPRGLAELVEFRRLSLNVGGRHAALAAVWHLFSHLANSVQAGEVGVLRGRDQDLLRAELADPAEFVALIEAGWLTERPEVEGDFICPLFARFNTHLDPGHRSRDSLGGKMKKLNQQIRQAEQTAVSQMALLPAESFRVEGRMLNSEEITHVRTLVRAVDGVTARADRKPHEGDWPADLIANAHAVVAKYGQPLAIGVCRELVRLGFDAGSGVPNPAVPTTTELCLRRFDQLVELVRRHPENRLA